jgi:hypothetical protein
MAFKTPYHQWQNFAGTSVGWFATDTQQLYEKNLKNPEKKQLLSDRGWINQTIVYQFNEHGFRSDNFDCGPGFVALGCSHTQGVGLHYEQLWATQVARTLGISSWNLGVAGAALDTCFRMSYYWLPLLRPKFVVLLAPTHRLEIHASNQVEVIHLATDDRVSRDGFLKNYATNEANNDINQLKNKLAIKLICNDLDIPFYCWDQTSWQQLPVNPVNAISIARDIMHPGPERHQNFANLILNTISNK